MSPDEARALIAPAIPAPGGAWADLGAGNGTFTRALAELLGPSGHVHAVDRAPAAVAALSALGRQHGGGQPSAEVEAVLGDFTAPLALPGLAPASLDGVLLANALHFAADAVTVLRRVAGLLRPNGRLVVVEYDRRAASRWVPYPVPAARLRGLAADAGLSPPVTVATRPSAYGGVLYVAHLEQAAAH